MFYGIAKKLAAWRGYELVRMRAEAPFPPDFSPEEVAACRQSQPQTMTTRERLVGVMRAVEYLVKAGIPGDLVECGVWRGGSMMAAALTLLRLGVSDRRLHLFDTFEGMSAPTEEDHTPIHKKSASDLLATGAKDSNIWAVAGLDVVKQNMAATGYPADRIHYVKGMVEQTIPAGAPPQIAMLRLDTDWYESTRHELIHLYPRLVSGGVLIIDDYGHWAGARKAVDEYLEQQRINLLLCRLDYTGRIAVKP